MKTKQVIVMRKDLNMRSGKMVSQGAHASLGVILKQMDYEDHDLEFKRLWIGGEGDPLYEWLENSFVKITVGVNSEEELLEIYNKTKDAGLETILIEDNGTTEFKGVKTKTCCAIGPDDSEKIDKITGHLKLL